jgi:hypothetical protein
MYGKYCEEHHSLLHKYSTCYREVLPCHYELVVIIYATLIVAALEEAAGPAGNVAPMEEMAGPAGAVAPMEEVAGPAGTVALLGFPG